MKKSILKICLAGLFFLAINGWAAAQGKMPYVYDITRESSNVVLLPDSCWQMLEDVEGKWTINQVSQPPVADQFHSNTGYKFDIETYWIRYRIKNKLDHEAKVIIRSIAAVHDLFIKLPNGDWQHQHTGWLVPWSEKDGMRGIGALSFSVQAGEELTVCRRIEFNFKINRPDELLMGFQVGGNYSDYYSYTELELLNETLEAIKFGLFLLTAILSFFFYRLTREKEFVRAAIGYGVLALLFANSTFFTLLRQYPLATNYAWRVVDSCAFFFTVFIVRSFLRTSARFPVWDKVLIAAGLIPFADLILRFISPTIIIPYRQELLIVVLLATALYMIRDKDKTARFVVIGILPLFTFLLCNKLFEIPTTPGFQLFWIGIEFLAYLWLITSLNRILFYRYKQLQIKLNAEALEKEHLAKEKEREKMELIEQQKVELEKQVTTRTEELKQSLDHLKSTQSQLIQSEKMASLGELTAGIAHEIQNPLNFVNNFSELNNELLTELKNEIEKGNVEEVKVIANAAIENQQKINHHGKRADSIVKGMLQHSRNSSGQKELTDINELCDEYLRLSYHGLRAKDKTFNAKFETEFDTSLPKLNVVPQDIGRVILNLINNAFYAVSEKKKQNANGYEPIVKIATKKIGNQAQLKVIDNGNGIPPKIADKIFQPFFTTKPSGQGTGLGLSLSYDIITKGHNGQIRVAAEENKGTEIIVTLPIK